MAAASPPPGRPHRKSAAMIYTLPIAIVIVMAVLTLSSFVQLLYLESLRLRPHHVASLAFFKETLQDRLGFETDEGANCFSLVKHTSILMLGLLYLYAFEEIFLESLAFAWLSLIVAAYAAPHILYRRTEGRWLLPAAPVLRLLALTAKPFVAILRFLQVLVEATDEKNGKDEPPTQVENVDALIDAGTEEGLIQEDDRKLIQSVVEFGDKLVREVMTPRPNIVAVSAQSTLEQLRQLVINEQYSRIPVYEESIDQIVGFVHVRDMFELEANERGRRTVRDLMRPIRFVPETKQAHDLLRDMQADGTHMVIVVDEYGNTAGLATMEDLVEVIVGEIRDEHEPGSDVTPVGDGSVLVSGSFDVARLHDLFDFRPQEETESTT